MALHLLRKLRDWLTADSWRFALVGGGLSALVVFSDYYRLPAAGVEVSPILVAGLIGGYLFHSNQERPTRVGFRTGLVGSIPVVWQAIQTLGSVLGLTQPTWFGIVQVGGVVVVTVLGIVLVGLSGAVAALAGDWLAGKVGRRRPSPTGE